MSKSIAVPVISPWHPLIVLFSASVMWGLTWLPMKYFQTAGVESLALILASYGAVAICSLPILFRQYLQWKSQSGMLLLILFLGGFANLAFATALIYGDVVRVMVLFYLTPAWGVIGGRIFLGERIDTQRALSVALALTGAFFILGGFSIFKQLPGLADLLALAAGFAFAMNNICFRASQALPVSSKVAVMFLGCALFAVLLLVYGLQEWPVHLPGSVWIGLVIFGLGWLLVATAGTQWGVTHMEAGRSSIIIIMELLTAVLSAALIQGNQLQPVEWMGGLLILTAALLEAWRPNT